MLGGAAVACLAHNQKVDGSIPSPATFSSEVAESGIALLLVAPCNNYVGSIPTLRDISAFLFFKNFNCVFFIQQFTVLWHIEFVVRRQCTLPELLWPPLPGGHSTA